MAKRERFEEYEAPPLVPARHHVCKDCKNVGGMNFDCLGCCVRWLRGMSPEARTLNAPIIEAVKGAEFMNQVRQAWRAR